MSLPVITSPEDLEKMVQYLRPKATGATREEAEAALGTTVADGRKVAGYKYWGFIKEDGDNLRLTNEGRQLARDLNDEERKQELLSEAIRNNKPYRMALDWIRYQDFEEVAVSDLAAHWIDHVPESIGTESEDTVRRQVTCFYQLAEGAGLGTYKKGRRGQPTRLIVNREAITQFVAETNLEPGAATEVEEEDTEGPEVEESAPPEGGVGPGLPGHVFGEDVEQPAVTKVFIAHGKNARILSQVETILESTGLDYEVAEKEETPAIPVPEKVFNAMRRCQAAVICVTADEEQQTGNGDYVINQNVLIEIGAAFVLYEKRVVLVWDRRLKIPSNLQGLYRCEFEGDELSWDSGMRLLNAIGKFKKDEPLR